MEIHPVLCIDQCHIDYFICLFWSLKVLHTIDFHNMDKTVEMFIKISLFVFC